MKKKQSYHFNRCHPIFLKFSALWALLKLTNKITNDYIQKNSAQREKAFSTLSTLSTEKKHNSDESAQKTHRSAQKITLEHCIKY
jgi:hypothetical protein